MPNEKACGTTMKMRGGRRSWMWIGQAAGRHDRSALLSRSVLGLDAGTAWRCLARSVAVLAMVVALLWTGKMALDNLLAWHAYGQNFPLRTDFALYYVFARIGLTHGWSHLYDLAAQRQVYDSLGP